MSRMMLFVGGWVVVVTDIVVGLVCEKNIMVIIIPWSDSSFFLSTSVPQKRPMAVMFGVANGLS